MNEDLEFKVKTNWEEITKLREEISKVEHELDSMDMGADGYSELLNTLTGLQNKMKDLVRQNVGLANSYEAEMSNSVKAVKDMMHDLDRQIMMQKADVDALNASIASKKIEQSGMDKTGDSYKKLSNEINYLKKNLQEEKQYLNDLNLARKTAQLTIKSLENDEKGLTNTYAEQGREIAQSTQNLQGSLMSMATKLAGGYGLFQFIDKMKSTRAEFQNMESAMTTIVGKGTAGKLMGELKELAKQSPLSMQAMVGAEKMMLSFGISAKDSTKYIKALSDVSMGQGSNFNSLALAFSQMSSAGKLMGQDLMQMVNAGFNPLEEISRKTGKSIGTLKEEMSKGAISAKMVQDAFISATEAGGKFYGMSEATANTISGQLSMLGDAWDNLFNELGKSTEGMFIGSIQATTKLVENFDKVVIAIGALVTAYGGLKAAELTEITITNNLNLLKASQVKIIKANGNSIKALSATQKASALGTIAWANAQKMLNVAMMACPYMLILGAIVAIGTALYAVWQNARKASEGQRMLTESIDGVQSKTNKEIVELEVLKGRLKNCEKGTAEYYEIKSKLEGLAQQHNVTLDEENVLLTENAKCWGEIKKAMLSANATDSYKEFKQKNEERLNKNLDEHIKSIAKLAKDDDYQQQVLVNGVIRTLELAKASGKIKADSTDAWDIRNLWDELADNKELYKDIEKAYGKGRVEPIMNAIYKEVRGYLVEVVNNNALMDSAESQFKNYGAKTSDANSRDERDIKADIDANRKAMDEQLKLMDSLDKGTEQYREAEQKYKEADAKWKQYLAEYALTTGGKMYDTSLENLSVVVARIETNTQKVKELQEKLKADNLMQSEKNSLEARMKSLNEKINADKATFKARTGKDYDKQTESEKQILANAYAELNKFRREQAEKQREQAYNDQRNLDKARIDAMEEGYAKQKALREFQREGEMHDIIKRSEERKKQVVATRKSEWELEQKVAEQNAKKQGKAFIKTTFNEEKFKKSDTYKNTEKAIDEQRDAEILATNAKHNREDREALQNNLKQYQTFQEKKAEIAKKYASVIIDVDDAIAKALEAGDELTSSRLMANKDNILKAKSKELMSVGMDELKEGGLYDLLFSDLTHASTDALEVMMDKFKEFGTKLPENLDPADLKAYRDAIQKLQDELYSRNTEDNVFSQWKNSVEEAGQATEAENKAREDLRKANEDKKKAQRQVDLARAREQRAQSALENNPSDPNVIKEATQAHEDLIKSINELEKAERKEAQTTASYSQAVEASEEAHNKMVKSSEKVKKTISDISDVAQKAGEILGDEGEEAMNFIANIGEFANSVLTAVQLTAKGAGEAIGAAERASAILAIIQVAFKLMEQIKAWLPNRDSEYEKEVNKQKELNQLVQSVNEYKRAVLEARLAEESWFSSSNIKGLQDTYALGINALENYYAKANELQKTYKDKDGGMSLSGILSFKGTGDKALDPMQEYTKAMDNLRMETRKATDGSLFHKSRKQQTQGLQEWIDANLGGDIKLFDEEGLIDLRVANMLLEDYSDKMVGETQQTIEMLKQAREEYDEYLNGLQDFVADGYGPLVDNLTSSVMTWLDTGEDALEMFQDSASSTFRNIAQDMIKQMAMQQVFDGYQDELTNVYKEYNKKVSQLKKGENYNEEYAKLQEELASEVAKITGGVLEKAEQQLPVLQDMAKSIDEQLNQVGIDISDNELDQKASAGGFQTMSESTATELNGRFTAVYEGELRIENAMTLFTETMHSLMLRQSDVALQSQEILANSYLELQEINTRMGLSNEQLAIIATAINKIQKEL